MGREKRSWANAHYREWREKKRRSRRGKRMGEVRLYATAFLLMVGTFCLVFFWPAGKGASVAAIPSANQFSCKVSRITDGDTLRCADGTRVRLHAVAARESDGSCKPGHPCPTASASEATATLSALASGQTLQCEQTGTSYNRVVAICRDEANIEINCAMIESGTALVWPRYNQERAICRR
ncbi:thermonuclease family protein [Rhizorhapis suberifaciens]|uniref:Endonuclease YncB(Thermonuclease family) n=1 Tax=Rhizorhapis suberifaciens TaxID=13656 RepID=A0A840HZ07_9SPHN|nr:thermonuclease family protein [Rhizorhapis suberifaciens]MBB4642644.1 endonuclease YncB(thermonuclease family) [Rhizorhapis suberifaciens]